MCLFKFTTYVGFHSVNLRMRWMYSIYLKKYAGGRPLCTYVNIYIYKYDFLICLPFFRFRYHEKPLQMPLVQAPLHPDIPKSDTCTWPQIEDIDPSTTSIGAEARCTNVLRTSVIRVKKNTFTSTNYQKLLWIPKTMVISCNFERCCVFFK